MIIDEIATIDPRGRLGRQGYFISFCIFAAVPWTAMFFSSTLGGLLLAVLGVWFLIVSARRLNDIGRSPWWALTLLVIYLNVLTLLILLFSKGEAEERAKGD